MAGTEFSVSGMTGRYATALFGLACDSGLRDQVLDQLDQFGAMLKTSKDLRHLVTSPVFSSDQQTRAVVAVLAKAGIDGLAANFVGLVAQNRRLFAIGAMIKDYRALVAH
ncbi:MAG: F0F1 ATP synthase subunit delta, partial [Alphaproteobacteria bacterium]